MADPADWVKLANGDHIKTAFYNLKRYDDNLNYAEMYDALCNTMIYNREEFALNHIWNIDDPKIIRKYAQPVATKLVEFAKKKDNTFEALPPFGQLMHQLESQGKNGGDTMASFADRAFGEW